MIPTIESYNLKEQKWENEGNLLHYRLKPITIALDTKIYIMSGLSSSYKHSKGQSVDTIEVYDTKAKKSSMLDFRFHFPLESILGVFLVGRNDFIIFSDEKKQVVATMLVVNDDNELYQEARLELFNYTEDQDYIKDELTVNRH